MHRYSRISIKRLSQVHPDLAKLFREVLTEYDHSVLCGHRTRREQDICNAKGVSKLRWPASKHNLVPSQAIDVAPYPIDWSNDPKNIARYYYFAGHVMGTAIKMGIKVRWGGDWDGDKNFYDQTFDDLVHFELLK